jgi:hypothetical protein
VSEYIQLARAGEHPWNGVRIPSPIYEIIPQWPDNPLIQTPWTVAVQALNDLPRGGTKDGTTLPTSWQNFVQSINSPEAFQLVQVQAFFWVNVPNVWPRIQNIGIMSQRVFVLDIALGWARIKTYKLSDDPYYDEYCIHEVYMVNQANRIVPIRAFPVKIILISDAGYLYVPVDRLRRVG